MIVISDNEATDLLADRVGPTNVTDYMHSLGLTHTSIQFSDLDWDCGRLRWRPSTGRLLKTCSCRRQKSKLPARGKASVIGEIGGSSVDRRCLRIVGISLSSCHRHCTFATAIVLWETPVSCYGEVANDIRHTA